MSRPILIVNNDNNMELIFYTQVCTAIYESPLNKSTTFVNTGQAQVIRTWLIRSST